MSCHALRSGRAAFREKLKQNLEKTGGLHCQRVGGSGRAGGRKRADKAAGVKEKRAAAASGAGAAAGPKGGRSGAKTTKGAKRIKREALSYTRSSSSSSSAPAPSFSESETGYGGIDADDGGGLGLDGGDGGDGFFPANGHGSRKPSNGQLSCMYDSSSGLLSDSNFRLGYATGSNNNNGANNAAHQSPGFNPVSPHSLLAEMGGEPVGQGAATRKMGSAGHSKSGSSRAVRTGRFFFHTRANADETRRTLPDPVKGKVVPADFLALFVSLHRLRSLFFSAFFSRQVTGGRFRPALTIDTGDGNVNTGSTASAAQGGRGKLRHQSIK